MCANGLSIREMVTHQTVDSKHPMQVINVGIEGSTSDMWVSILSCISPLGFIVSNGLWWVWRCQNLVWYSCDKRFLDTLEHCLDLMGLFFTLSQSCLAKIIGVTWGWFEVKWQSRCLKFFWDCVCHLPPVFWKWEGLQKDVCDSSWEINSLRAGRGTG